MQDIDKYIDEFPYPTRAERMNVALISLLMALNDKVDKLIPVEVKTPESAFKEHIEVSVEKPIKKTNKKVSK